MSYLSLLLLAIGLCFDTFAVSLSGGMGKKYSAVAVLKIVAVFAVLQTAMFVIGWLLGVSVSGYIEQVDHWAAFFLLAFIGGKMIVESLKKEEGKPVDFQRMQVLVIVALATSIDAIAIGVSLALVDISVADLFAGSTMVFIITAVAAFVGLLGGHRLKKYIGRRSELLGGIILVGIGLKILLEHLGVL